MTRELPDHRNRARLRPVKGQMVRIPYGKRGECLPEDGKVVDLTSYWCQQIVKGRVEVVDHPKPAKHSKPNRAQKQKPPQKQKTKDQG